MQDVEAGLRRHEAVRDAAEVRAPAAFFPARPGAQAPVAADLRGFLKGGLPDCMVPAEYRALAARPLNASGKVDRHRLLAMDGAAPSIASVAPRTPVEELVAEVWQEPLGAGACGIDDDFFDLGGHSLLAMQVGFRLEEETGVAVARTDLFRHPTIRAFAESAGDLEDMGGTA